MVVRIPQYWDVSPHPALIIEAFIPNRRALIQNPISPSRSIKPRLGPVRALKHKALNPKPEHFRSQDSVFSALGLGVQGFQFRVRGIREQQI